MPAVECSVPPHRGQMSGEPVDAGSASGMDPLVDADTSRAHRDQGRREQDDQPSPELPNWLPAV
jgi:hypothetical protein